MAILGLLSDSHGRSRTTYQAVDLLLENGAECLIHLGDVGSVEVIDALAATDAQGKPVPAHLVFGNTDWDLQPMANYAGELDIGVHQPAGELSFGDVTIVFCHGHQDQPMQDAVSRGVNYLFHGHTHKTEDRRIGSTRVVNPGALFRASRYTVALLDTETDKLTFLELNTGS